MTMRVLHALQELDYGGAESICALLVDGARQAGIDVAVAAAPGAFEDAFPVRRFNLPIIRRAPIALMRAARALRRAVHTWRPDIIHCHNPAMAMAAVLATGRGRSPRKLVTVHGMSDADYAMTARILRWLAQETVACGPGVAALLRERGLDTTLIANGCSAPPPALDRRTLEREFPALRGRALVVGVGRLAAVKNFRALIRAAGLLPNAMVVIAGEGPARQTLLDEAIRVGAQDRVVLPGYRRDARALIGAADVVVINSSSEGLPLVAIESMLAGTPLVAARAAWQKDVLNDGCDCLLVPWDDALATARAVERLLDDPGLARRVSANARITSAAYSANATVEAYLDLYRRLALPP